jgi:phage protein D
MPDADGKPQFYAARPTISVERRARAELGDSQLLSLLVEETTLGLFRCEARFLNWGPKDDAVGFLHFGLDVVDFGKEFAVEMGPPGESRRVFEGRITGFEAQYPHERAPELTVLAEDRFQDLRMERRTRAFTDVSDADVIRRIAGPHGLAAQVDLDGPTHRVLTQVNQSDLAFLRERAAAVDAELWVEGRTLHAQARARRDAGRVSLTYGKNLLEFSVLADLAHQRSAVQVTGWDVGGKQAIEVEADEKSISAELGGGRGGSAVLARAFTRRTERVATAVPLSREEARALAEARYKARARGFLRGTGIADGEAGIRVGTTVELAGAGKLFDGKYYVSVCRHTFDLRYGYRTTFEVERPGLGT